ncbi:hypothetical protein K3495_g2971 [Podosphaera aphanis]|nr:hypothetical protein K3495_g2971 [Podosphaera aphanis]
MKKEARERTRKADANANYVSVQDINSDDSNYLKVPVVKSVASLLDKLNTYLSIGLQSLNKSFKANLYRKFRLAKARLRNRILVLILLLCVLLIGPYALLFSMIILLNLLINKTAKACPAVTIRALLSKTDKPLTIVDSGASEHFSRIKSDFSSLKRWSAPRTVQIADGKVIKCEGYGTISFKTDDKKIDLKEVWFVPDFGNMRLLSVGAFNMRGIDVTFVNNECHVKRGSKTLFEACVSRSKQERLRS